MFGLTTRPDSTLSNMNITLISLSWA